MLHSVLQTNPGSKVKMRRTHNLLILRQRPISRRSKLKSRPYAPENHVILWPEPAELSLCLRKRSPRLGYLLIQIRRIDIGQLLAGAYAIADIDIALHVQRRRQGGLYFRGGGP
jgi:hypothetical protein